MERKPLHEIDGFGEACFAVIFGVGIWGFYGFPHFVIIAPVCVAAACFAAYVWK